MEGQKQVIEVSIFTTFSSLSSELHWSGLLSCYNGGVQVQVVPCYNEQN